MYLILCIGGCLHGRQLRVAVGWGSLVRRVAYNADVSITCRICFAVDGACECHAVEHRFVHLAAVSILSVADNTHADGRVGAHVERGEPRGSLPVVRAAAQVGGRRRRRRRRLFVFSLPPSDRGGGCDGGGGGLCLCAGREDRLSVCCTTNTSTFCCCFVFAVRCKFGRDFYYAHEM